MKPLIERDCNIAGSILRVVRLQVSRRIDGSWKSVCTEYSVVLVLDAASSVKSSNLASLCLDIFKLNMHTEIVKTRRVIIF